MALLFDAPLTNVVTDFDGVQANGVFIDPRGVAAPIPGWVEINAAPDGSTALMSRISPSDTQTYGGIRSEIDYFPEANAERWYRWEMFLPIDFSQVDPINLMQVHDSPDGGESPIKAPNFVLYAHEGLIRFVVPLNCPVESSSLGRYPLQGATELIVGRWVTCALHTNFDPGQSGFIEFFYDGKTLGKEWSRPCGYTDSVGPYWKLGLYDHTHSGLISEYRAWYRNARLYSQGHSENEVLGLRPALTESSQVFDFA